MGRKHKIKERARKVRDRAGKRKTKIQRPSESDSPKQSVRGLQNLARQI